MWYKNAYRRHLCDMHINDWNESFLSEFNVQEYFENLKTAKIQNAMIYLQSHAGLCYFPTKTGKMHASLKGREDLIKRLVEKCRTNGISVTGYYSLIYNNAEFEKHPEWAMIDKNGVAWLGTENNADEDYSTNRLFRYGLCCPNNIEYREFVLKQIEEIQEYFDVDGMFYDMLFWPHLCYCDSCKKRWAEEVGGEIPTIEDWNDEKWLLHMEKRRKWMGEFAQLVTDKTKTINPNLSVEHNFANAVLPNRVRNEAEEVNNACDFSGGDLYGNLYSHSFTCKFYINITKNQPFEYMFARCEENLSKHTLTKAKNVMLSSVFLTTAHHGATLVIDAIDPVGTMDGRLYEQLGEVFDQSIPYEKYMYGDMVEDVGIYYTLKSKFNPYGEKYINHHSAVNTMETMVINNIPCGVTGGFHGIEKYKVLVAPLLTSQDEYDNKRIINYVKNGGNLYLSGADNKTLLKELLGIDFNERTIEKIVYISPNEKAKGVFGQFNKKYPLHFDGSAPVAINYDENDVIATFTLPYTNQETVKFASIHSNPPGVETNIPAAIYKEYGKGKVFWSAVPFESLSNYYYREIFVNILNTFLSLDATVKSDAPKDVELVTFKTDNEMLLSTVLLNDDRKARRVEDFTISIKSEVMPKNIVLLPNNTPVNFEYKNGEVNFQSKNMKIFNMYKIQF